ncbi:basic salivary proline-rich protein 4-like [Asparagus officinalis]|uniref:basic salivary proline-rich protein 4-like n=1 Tax=Asparagus officinalis TaxID=4686 RepID=UPI00098E0B4E|nr:basic salivary proline-rich protein 4-like [Asparagus officinalis]
MATKPQMSGEGFNAIAGMSRSQLYDLMSQMKLLIEQNHQQAKQILIDNPMLTRGLFQAQVMLGMVLPTQPANIQKVLSQPQSAQLVQQSNVQSTQSLPPQPSHQVQSNSSHPSVSARQQQLPQQSISQPSASLPPMSIHSQTAPSIPPYSAQQAKGPSNAQIPSMSAPQSSQLHNLPLPPPQGPPHPQYSISQPHHVPILSSQPQPSLQMPGIFNQPMQPPLPQQPRPPSMQQSFAHQHHGQMPHLGFQTTSAPQQHLSQPMFHSGGNIGSQFQQGLPPPLPNQPPPQHIYQGGPPNMGSEYNQGGNSMQQERGGPRWGPGVPERASGGSHLPGPPPLGPGQMLQGLGGGGQQPCPPPLTPDMEKALLQQVMSLTPEQINMLPPEQRQQVIQLQGMLRS